MNKNSITLSKKNSNGFVIIEEILEFFFGDPTKDKYNYSYDEKGNNIEVLSTFWENSSWMNNSLEVSTFGTMTQRTESLLKFWQNNLWINRFKSEYSYDANSNMIQRIEYELKNSWVLSSRQSYVYDENNNELEWRMEWRDGDKWVPFIQVLSTYDESGNILTSTFKWGNNEGTAFENSSMQEYIYDANNNLIELKSKYWDSGEWIDEGSEIYTYNEDGSVEILVQYIGDSQPTKILMTYNEYQNITSSTTSVLQEDGVTWIEVYRETYTYDENQNNISHLAENYWNGTS